jgi:hypothetical protein
MREEYVHLLGGSISGLLSDSVVHPIDTLRVNIL